MLLKYVPPATLEQMLNNYTVDKLQSIARAVLRKKLTRKPDLVSALCAFMSSTPLLKIWEKVDYAQQLAMSEAVHNQETPGRLDWVRLEAKYRGFRNPLDYQHLHKSAVALLVDEEGTIPPEFLPELRRIVPEPDEIEVEVDQQLPAALAYRHPLEVREVIWWVLEDLVAVLQLIDAGMVRVTKSLSPTEASMRALSEVLAGGDFYDEDESPIATVKHMKVFAWPLLLQIGGLATPIDTKLMLTAMGHKALKSPSYNVIHKLWTDFLQTTSFDEFERIEGLARPVKEYQKFLIPVDQRRAAVVEVIAKCPAGLWISVDELLRFICATSKDFSVTRDYKVSQLFPASVAWQRYEDWRIVAGRYSLTLLFEYAATLGLIDVAYSTPEMVADDYREDNRSGEESTYCHCDGLAYIRINQLGGYCFGITDDLQLPPNLVKQKQVSLVDIVHNTDEIQIYKPFRKMRRYLDIPDPEDIHFPVAKQDTANVRDCGAARVFSIVDSDLAAEIHNDAFWTDSIIWLYENLLVVPEQLVPAFCARLKKKGYIIS